MRKIGILTFHTAENYGAVLQAYALQNYLQREYPNDSIDIINFKTKDHIKDYAIFKKRHHHIIYDAIIWLLTIFRLRQLLLRKLNFKNFVNKELSLTKRYMTEQDLLTNITPMDIYISGSDQVFNPFNKYYKAYYLGFKKKNAKKIAYAPSFGINNFTSNIRKNIEPYIKDFDALCCRESEGSDFIESIIGNSVSTVCDPVFLLNKAEWLSIANSPSIPKKYIFVYDLSGGKSLIDIAKKIKKATGFQIICQTQTVQRFYFIDKQIYSSGPKEFIGLIANAEYVITDSFHGTLFSIVFRKKFYSYIANPNTSSRILNILNLLMLQDRCITNGQSNEFVFSSEEVNNYEKKLNEFISKSKSILTKALEC